MAKDTRTEIGEMPGRENDGGGKRGTRRRFSINGNFALLWVGQTISEFGSRITREGLPLTANLTLRVAPSQMGVLAALGTAPVLLVGLLAGVWVDRLRRRPILIATDILRAALLGTIPLAALLGLLRVEQVYVVAALAGILSVFYEVAAQSFLPSVVPQERIVEGNSKLEASSSLAEIGGPALAGVLVQAITAPMAILFDALSFLPSAVCAWFMRTAEPKPTPREERQSMWSDVREGLSMVLGNPLLRTTTINTSARGFFGGAYATLYGLFLIRELGISPAVYGVLVTMGGVGALAGAFLAGRILRRWGLGVTLIGAAVLSRCVSLLTPLAGGPLIVVVAMLLVAQLVGDFGEEVYFINEVSLRQTIIPARFLGRVNASVHFLVGGMVPVGALLAGVVAELIGMRYTLLIASCASLLFSCVWLFLSPIRRLRELPKIEG